MLVLSRKNHESVVVGGVGGDDHQLKVTVLAIAGGRVKLGFEVASHISVQRLEIWERMQAAGEFDAPAVPRDARADALHWRSEEAEMSG